MAAKTESLFHVAPPVEERWADGKALRSEVPRSSHAEFTPAPDRPDVIDLLQAQDTERIEKLLPIKYGRMVVSPFTFFRGSAAVMAYDLASTPMTNLTVQLCGDAHISNFGVFASPERHLVFDMNDFDETYRGSWEWDLKRLTASIVIAGRDNGFSEKLCRELVQTAFSMYRMAMQAAANMNLLDVWYHHVDTDMIMKFQNMVQVTRSKGMDALLKKAQSRTQRRSLEKMTEVVDGRRRFRSEPPLLVPSRELLDSVMAEEVVSHAWTGYKDSLTTELRVLVERYSVIGAARRVGGVGSVGTRCYVVLLQGRDIDDCLILQQKEVGPSCLEPYFPKLPFVNDAERVVHGQRAIQATPDIFLGWHQGSFSTDRHYYWRQLADMKGSADISLLDENAFRGYISVCAVTLARAHARTGDAAPIAGYIGTRDTFGEALEAFSVAYADQAARDHAVLVQAVEDGRIAVEMGV